MKIVVDERAAQKIEKTAQYIQEEFGRKARRDFVQALRDIVKLLCQNPNMGPSEPYLVDAPVMYRSIVVNNLNKMIYWINGEVIEVVDFWDTRREPENQASRFMKPET